MTSRRLPHVLTPKDLAVVLAPTYAKAAAVDVEEARERLERLVQSQHAVDALYRGLNAALAERTTLRTGEDAVIDKLSEGLGTRRSRVKAAPQTPAVSAVLVFINLELGYAPEMMRNTLDSPRGRELLEEGLRELGVHLLRELIK